jgi:hypothetical protein
MDFSSFRLEEFFAKPHSLLHLYILQPLALNAQPALSFPLSCWLQSTWLRLISILRIFDHKSSQSH